MAWEGAIATIQGSFGSVLLPTERKCEAIVVFRDRLDAEFVDGLVAASRRLLVGVSSRGAVARSGGLSARCGARGRGSGPHARADGHRSALGRLQTFFACRDRLSRTLGLDPSPALAALYRQLLEGELSFAQGEAGEAAKRAGSDTRLTRCLPQRRSTMEPDRSA